MTIFSNFKPTVPDGWRDRIAGWVNPALAWLQRRRKPVAIIVSFVLHLLVLLLMLPQAETPGGFAGGAGGTDSGAGEGISLDLTAFNDSSKDALTVKATTPDDAADIVTPIDQLMVADAQPQPQLSDLSDAVAQATPQPQPKSAESAAQDAAAAAGGPGQDGATTGDGDALWAAIAPCWRKMASADALPVQLSVSFSSDGHLAVPPDIVRDPDQQGGMTGLRSETQAIQALAACGAYAMASGKQNVQIHFPKPN